MAHIRHLAGYGIHDAGSKSERYAAGYIRAEMRRAGLSVATESFSFHAFTLQDAVLTTGAAKAKIVKLAFDPYGTRSPITGDLAIVTSKIPRDVLAMDLDGRIAVVADDNSFRIASILKQPKAVLSLSSADFEQLKAATPSTARIEFRGKEHVARSSNIIGTLRGSPGAREILISAHYDSVRGPGANDNASGISALLELARYFNASQIPRGATLRFVAFGAEEAGLLGSKAYLRKHTDELKNCELLFNIDEVGGNAGLHVDTGEGVKGVSDKVESKLPDELTDKATNDIKDPEQRWQLLSPGDRALWMSSNVPPWLRAEILKASANLRYKIEERNRTGSDHRVFVQAGVVATHIGSDGGAVVHAPTDVPDAVDPRNVELAARIVLSVVEDLSCSELNSTNSK